MSLYSALKYAGCEMDNHCSDLYVRMNLTARNIIIEHGHEPSAFCGTDGRMWYEIPFMYEPWWQARQTKRSA